WRNSASSGCAMTASPIQFGAITSAWALMVGSRPGTIGLVRSIVRLTAPLWRGRTRRASTLFTSEQSTFALGPGRPRPARAAPVLAGGVELGAGGGGRGGGRTGGGGGRGGGGREAGGRTPHPGSVGAAGDRPRFEPVDRAAVRALRLPTVHDVEVDPRMRRPQRHLRVGAIGRQVV